VAFLDLFRRQSERRVVTSSAAIPKNSDGYYAAGVPVTALGAMQLAAVNACVRLLADSIAGLPLDAYRKRDGLSVEVTPTPGIVAVPFGDDLTHFEGFDQIGRCLATTGESLSLISGMDYLERPTEIYPIHPDDWQVRRDERTGDPRYSVYSQGRLVGKFGPAEVLHIKRFSLPGLLHGLSPIEQAAQGIGLGIAAERYGARWFADSANPSAVLESTEDMTDDQVALTQRQWIDSHGGRRFPAVMTGGLKYRPITITPNESQFLETRKFQRGEIAMLYGIPPHMIGDTDKSTSWGTGIEQQSIGFVRYTLRPWLTCIEQAFSTLLPRGQYVRFNVEALLRGATLERYMSYVHARNAGWLNVNEIRAKEDLGPVEGGEQYIQPLNMGPLGSDPLAERQSQQSGEPA
jgi:HK97 family phage portal protein